MYSLGGSLIVEVIILGLFVILPIYLVVIEIFFLVKQIRNRNVKKTFFIDQISTWYGAWLVWLYMGLIKEATDRDWQVQLNNSATHSPIFTEAQLTVTFIFFIAMAGYCYLYFSNIEKTPPLLSVISISAMYLGVIVLAVFIIQVVSIVSDLFLCLYLLGVILIAARMIIKKIQEYQDSTMEKQKIRGNAFLDGLDRLLSKATLWPLYALILMLPLLGIIIAILILFGQAPDSIIKAWTETSDWRLSMREAPPNVYVDQHYLCTVAAGGHRKIVKPLRRGIRHGHEVIVNRQLCIANAFEQILEEKTPRLHKVIRGFYDRYGFPVAKLIRKKWIADIIYFFMKPLEWIFLAVIYMSDAHPENRIALQYMGNKFEYRK